jgi:hypothetical protein
MATKALNLVRWPALVCFWTGIIFSTSSFNEDPRKKSMISDSYNMIKHFQKRQDGNKTIINTPLIVLLV